MGRNNQILQRIFLFQGLHQGFQNLLLPGSAHIVAVQMTNSGVSYRLFACKMNLPVFVEIVRVGKGKIFGFQIQSREIVVDFMHLIFCNRQIHAAKGVHDFRHLEKVYGNIVLNIQVKILIQRFNGQLRPAIGIGMGDLIAAVALDLHLRIPENRGQFQFVVTLVHS